MIVVAVVVTIVVIQAQPQLLDHIAHNRVIVIVLAMITCIIIVRLLIQWIIKS